MIGRILGEINHLRTKLPTLAIDDLDALTLSSEVGVYIVDISSQCNLRCVYCPVSGPDYHGQDMAADTLTAVREMILRHRPRSLVYLSAGGETTAMAGWEQVARDFLDADLRCAIITNFARVLSDEEIDLLSRFAEVMISLDTVDPVLLREIRRKVDVRTILYNMGRLKAASIERDNPPTIVWNSVMYDRSVLRVRELAKAAVVYGPNQVTFAPLTKSELVPDVPLRQLSELSPDERQTAAGYLADAERILSDGGVIPAINANLKMELGLIAEQVPGRLVPGLTRDCLQPWEFFMPGADGRVAVCCNAHGVTVGRVTAERDPFEDTFNGSEIRRWRRALLEGNLPLPCRDCQAYPLTTPAALADRVKSLGRRSASE